MPFGVFIDCSNEDVFLLHSSSNILYFGPFVSQLFDYMRERVIVKQ